MQSHVLGGKGKGELSEESVTSCYFASFAACTVFPVLSFSDDCMFAKPFSGSVYVHSTTQLF